MSASATGNGRRCPTCRGSGGAVGTRCFPFCSVRCQEVDLGRWLSEDYRIPDRSGEPDGEAAAALAQASGEPDER